MLDQIGRRHHCQFVSVRWVPLVNDHAEAWSQQSPVSRIEKDDGP